MTLAARIDIAAGRAGYHSMAALARACEVTPPAITALVSGSRPMSELLDRIADKIGVSAQWLRTGDPASAPSWADPVQVARDAVAGLSDIDRLRFLADQALDQAEAEHEPNVAAARLALVRKRADELALAVAEVQRQMAGLQAALGDPTHAPAKPTGRNGPKFQPRARSPVST
jgi:transcriptional regulator with XRE-family HTH domain